MKRAQALALIADLKSNGYYNKVIISHLVKDHGLKEGTAAAYTYTVKNVSQVAVAPKKKITVKSLRTGKDIEIDEDTPIGCDPSSETYLNTK